PIFNLLQDRPKAGKGVHDKRKRERNGSCKKFAISTEGPSQCPVAPELTSHPPSILTFEVHLDRKPPHDIVAEVRTVLPVYEDHRRERDLFVEPRAFFQARLPERRETDQVKIAIAQEIEDLLAG